MLHGQAADIGEFADELAKATKVPRDKVLINLIGAVRRTARGSRRVRRRSDVLLSSLSRPKRCCACPCSGRVAPAVAEVAANFDLEQIVSTTRPLYVRAPQRTQLPVRRVEQRAIKVLHRDADEAVDEAREHSLDLWLVAGPCCRWPGLIGMAFHPRTTGDQWPVLRRSIRARRRRRAINGDIVIAEFQRRTNLLRSMPESRPVRTVAGQPSTVRYSQAMSRWNGLSDLDRSMIVPRQDARSDGVRSVIAARERRNRHLWRARLQQPWRASFDRRTAISRLRLRGEDRRRWGRRLASARRRRADIGRGSAMATTPSRAVEGRALRRRAAAAVELHRGRSAR